MKGLSHKRVFACVAAPVFLEKIVKERMMMDIMEWKDRAKIAVILGSGLNDTIDE